MVTLSFLQVMQSPPKTILCIRLFRCSGENSVVKSSHITEWFRGTHSPPLSILAGLFTYLHYSSQVTQGPPGSSPRKDTQTLQKVWNWNLLAASSRVLALAESMTSEPV